MFTIFKNSDFMEIKINPSVILKMNVFFVIQMLLVQFIDLQKSQKLNDLKIWPAFEEYSKIKLLVIIEMILVK
jgi:hypothetical protein